MEDTGEVEDMSSGTYLAVHDGHGGHEASAFLHEHLFENFRDEIVAQGGRVTEETLRAVFAKTEEQFTEIVHASFLSAPYLATVGACSAVAFVTSDSVWVANVGDCRVFLGQVRTVEDGEQEVRALQLTKDHNLSDPSVRAAFISQHADTPDVVVSKRGRHRVKGKINITRSFGDLYMKAREFNRDPLPSRFRVSEPFHPPLLTAEPDILQHRIDPNTDNFLVVASDGLYDLLPNDELAHVIATSPQKDIARHLVRLALHRAARKNDTSYEEVLRMPSGQRRHLHDDITVIVFFFNHKTGRRIRWQQRHRTGGAHFASSRDITAAGGLGSDSAALSELSDFALNSSSEGFGTGSQSLSTFETYTRAGTGNSQGSRGGETSSVVDA
eukprot:TRINITY_DN3921_c0_g3_i2.p1 TRINITY_DN3921_c0_g3~~TRINITY_DN3921_c0_g3_i2.p1  ORF type:complete len:447 (+),score=98.83 TRINITY_DN3921_c0_g3_i2:187-1341(+)